MAVQLNGLVGAPPAPPAPSALAGTAAAATAMHATLLGEPWLISAPPALTGFLHGCLGHLITPPDAAGDPLRLHIRHEPTSDLAGGPTTTQGRGTVQRRDGSVLRQAYPGTSITYDSAARTATVALHDDDVLAAAVGTEALSRLLTLRAADLGMVPIHAAAIGSRGRFWLIPAAGGTGKSTAAALGVAAGLDSLGDDFVMWDPPAGTAHSISRTLRLTPTSVQGLGGRLRDAGFAELWHRGDGKAVLAMPEHRMASTGTIAGLLLIGEEQPGADPAAAYRALSSSLLLHSLAGIHPGDSARQLSRLARNTARHALRRDPDLSRWAATLVEVCGE